MDFAQTSEAEIQAEFYCACKVSGIVVRLELSTPVGRLDAAIMSDDGQRIVAVVECKKSKFAYENTKQIRKYQLLGVPVILLKSLDEIQSVVEKVKPLRNTTGLDRHSMWKIRKPHVYKVKRTIRLDPDLNFKHSRCY